MHRIFASKYVTKAVALLPLIFRLIIDNQREIIDVLQQEIKELNITINLLKKICKVSWDNDAFTGIIECL